MKRIVKAASPLIALFAFGAASAAVAAPDGLAKALAGRTAGKPVSCINQKNIDSSTIVDGAIIYREKGGLLYVNRPDKGRCTILQPDRQLVTRTTVTQLCQLDNVRVVDMVSRMQYGSCTLGDFVPYAKPAKPAR
jgi:hypothetical protein